MDVIKFKRRELTESEKKDIEEYRKIKESEVKKLRRYNYYTLYTGEFWVE